MNRDNIKNIIIVIATAMLTLLMVRSCAGPETVYIDTSKDSLIYYKSKYAQAVYYVNMRDQDLRDACEGRDSLSRVIKELEKKTKAKTVALARAKTRVIYDTVRTSDTVYTEPPREIEIALGFTDNAQAFLTSEQLGVESLSVSFDDEALARKYKDRYKWGVGVTAGAGVSCGINGWSVGPSVTIGIHRSIVTFGRRRRR